jgi:hypothetical protein
VAWTRPTAGEASIGGVRWFKIEESGMGHVSDTLIGVWLRQR